MQVCNSHLTKGVSTFLCNFCVTIQEAPLPSPCPQQNSWFLNFHKMLHRNGWTRVAPSTNLMNCHLMNCIFTYAALEEYEKVLEFRLRRRVGKRGSRGDSIELTHKSSQVNGLYDGSVGWALASQAGDQGSIPSWVCRVVALGRLIMYNRPGPLSLWS